MTTNKPTFPEPGDDAWPPCEDPMCDHYMAPWWPAAIEQWELDMEDATAPSGLPNSFW